MKIVIIGGVAAGTKAAAKIKRENREAQVILLTKSKEISYAGCGLPYYIGGLIEESAELIVNTPEKYAGLTGAQVRTENEVIAVHPAQKSVDVRRADGSVYSESYDSLILATGAAPVVPPVAGIDLPGVFTVRTPNDAITLRDYLQAHNCRNAVVAGAGFIGLEVAENLRTQGLNVTVFDAATQILPNILDPEMASYAKKQLRSAGIRVLTGEKLMAVQGEGQAESVQTSGGVLPADVVVLAIGIRPATAFLQGIGLEMERGAILTDVYMRTNLPDIYAAGDCAMVRDIVTGKPRYSPMGSTANLSARAMAKTITGNPSAYAGCLGTGVIKLCETLSAGRTGLGEEQARAAGYDPATAVCVTDDKAHYYPNSSFFVTKLIADRATHRLLGAQVLGTGAVDKMTDLAALGIASGMTVEAYDTVDFAYAPPFSTAIHPFVQACYLLENKLAGELESFTPSEYLSGAASGYTVIDVQPQASIPGAEWADLTKLDAGLPGHAKDEKLLLVCTKGKRAYFAQNRLKYAGYTATRVLEGGVFFNAVKGKQGATISPEEMKRVKGLGCLWDKRTPDIFNVRVITRNGKLTASEQRKVAEAAEIYGSGEVTMTTRLTLEIQGVPFSAIDDLIAFLAEAGLETGGTGSKVRPVVSCKGTTCQYGLIDTFDLSEKLHDLYYKGYHDVVLPHKFKIAVGGCPNNCVKPDLNDLGIIGQRVPEPNLEKCRGCKVCQVEKSCPIHIASLKDGKLNIDPSACNHCGRCAGKCPFGALEEYTGGYRIVIGGRWGKKIAQGRALERLFTTEEEVIDMVERAILLFRDEGITGERFADTVARLGFDVVQDKLLHGVFDKTAMRCKVVKGGATC